MAEYMDKDELLSYLYNLQDEPHDIAIEIAQFPAADVAPVVHGRWQVYETEKCTRWDKWGNPKYVINKIFHCPLCGKGTVIKSRFCPHCGANMDG